MKRKVFLMVIAVLVVCLTCGMLLVACNQKKKTDDGGKKPPVVTETWETDAASMLKEVYNKIGAGIKTEDGKKFFADFDVTLSIDDKTEANDDSKYRVIAKGAIDLHQGKESTFIVQVSDVTSETEKVLAGIAYEVIDGTPYLYVDLADGGYRKINGFSLTDLVAMIQKRTAGKGSETAAGSAGLDIQQIIDNIMSDPTNIFPLLETFGVVKNGTMKDYGKVYEVPFNFASLFSVVKDLEGQIPAAYKDPIVAALNYLLKQDFKDVVEDDKVVKSAFSQAIDYIVGKLSYMKMTATFTFDENDNFKSAKAVVDYNEANEDGNIQSVGTYTLDVNKAQLNIVEIGDVFEGTPVNAEVRAQEALNLLNFTLKGTATGKTSSGSVNRKYDIVVQSDVDPFSLLQIIGDSSKENIAAQLKKLGYFHLEINEVNPTSGDFVQNIIMLHSKFEDGFAVAQVNAYDIDIIGATLAIGGVYDFDDLVDVIARLTSETKSDAAATSAADVDVTKLIVKLVDFFNFSNIREEGLVVSVKSLVSTLLTDLASMDSFTASIAAGSLTGSMETVAIQLEKPVFGNVKAENYVAYSDLQPNNMQGKYTLNKDKYYREITSSDVKFHYSPADGNYIVEGTSQDGAYLFNGKDVTGAEGQFYGVVMGVYPVGEVSDGKVKVRVYVGQASEMVQGLVALGSQGLKLPSMAPLMGVKSFETEATVFDMTGEKSFTQTRFFTGETVWGSSNIIGVKIGDLVYNETFSKSNVTILDSKGEDVTSTVIRSGLLSTKIGSQTGVYTMKYKFNIGEVSAPITVGKLSIVYDGKLALGAEFDPSKFYAAYVYVDAEGKTVTERLDDVALDSSLFTYKMGNATQAVSAADILDAGKIKTGDLSWDKMVIYSSAKISVTSQLGNTVSVGGNSYTSASKLEVDTGYKFDIRIPAYEGCKYSFSFAKGDKNYTVKYDAGSKAWTVYGADGQKAESFSATVTVNGESMTATANGVLVMPRTEKSFKIIVKITTPDGVYTAESENMYVIYAADKSVGASWAFNYFLGNYYYLGKTLENGTDAKTGTLKYENGKLNFVDKDGNLLYSAEVGMTLNGESASFNEDGTIAGAQTGNVYVVTYKITVDEGYVIEFVQKLTIS